MENFCNNILYKFFACCFQSRTCMVTYNEQAGTIIERFIDDDLVGSFRDFVIFENFAY